MSSREEAMPTPGKTPWTPSDPWIPADDKLEGRIHQVLHDPATSCWLKDALYRALKRDCVNAAEDAEVLCGILKDRAKYFC
jgi:hypothetical protein